MTTPALLARVLRSGFEESLHFGHVAACDARGRVLAFAGDPDRPVFARSSMKPLQAAVALNVIDDDLSDAEIAVMCASHSGEPVHVQAVLRLLERGGTGPEALRCPPAWPWYRDEAAEHPRPEVHNCSGKHAGMVLACTRAGWDVPTYPHPEHPLQRAVLRAVGEYSGTRDPVVGVDGCGVPVHGMPLHAMATLFARVAGSWGELPVRRAVRAMQAEPYLVAGRDGVDTAVMEANEGLIVKTGAEGLLCAGVVADGVGFAVKVEDGSPRAAGPALIESLRQRSYLDDDRLQRLEPFARPPVTGGGRPVGHVEAVVRLSLR